MAWRLDSERDVTVSTTNKPVTFGELAPLPRLLMGPGPINVDPRVLRAMSAPLMGQFDPAFTAYMNEAMVLYRQVWQTENQWSFLIDGTSRAAIEAVLVSSCEPGDRVLVPSFGRFGLLLAEIAERCGAVVDVLERPWGQVFEPEEIEAAIKRFRPKLLAVVHGDTSTTMLQPLADIAGICRSNDVLLYTDATASLGGNDLPIDAWGIDAATAGLQKCLAGPSGSAPITLGERIVRVINRRRVVERGIREAVDEADHEIRPIASNYFDLAMLMDYWGERRLNHHTEAATMLYGARECARLLLEEGIPHSIARHRLAGDALVAGLEALGLGIFGDQRHKMANVTGIFIPDGVSADGVRHMMLNAFGIEIGTSFGPLHGKIWRIGTMGYNAREDCVLVTLGALEACLRAHGFKGPADGRGVDAALAVYQRSKGQ
jgi:(S)-ureidoglycine-glyoxylate aminotransferase